jgi:hypothetical protein
LDLPSRKTTAFAPKQNSGLIKRDQPVIKENMMKKMTVFVIVLMLTVLASTVIAGDKGEGKGGKLFLFQKCDESLFELDPAAYDASGCPNADFEGPWPIYPDNRRWGQLHYNLVGDTFRYSFQGKRLVPESDYTLIYYPDPWPGSNLMCLGDGTSNPAGNLQIHGEKEILTGLPTPDDANFYAGGETVVGPSGATGAKIWLVLSADVQCNSTTITEDTEDILIPSQMLGWTPSAYLFEGNLIVYQYSDLSLADDEEEETEDPEPEVVEAQGYSEEYSEPAQENNGNGNQGQGQGNSNGNAKGKK